VIGTIRAVGVDVGARVLHAVVLDGSGRVAGVARWPADDPGEAVAAIMGWAAERPEAAGVGVDSPDAWSTAPHLGDGSLSPKFATARCGEIALGRRHGVWVPWTTPVEPRPGTWMDAGIRLFAALRAAGLAAVEVYSHAVFAALAAGRRLRPKTSPAGRVQRLALLAPLALPPAAGHDHLDAAAAALVALHHATGRARPVTCGHDGSAIWLPSPPPLPAGVAEPALPPD
jgi:predicted nuclease with RNAse H fold